MKVLVLEDDADIRQLLTLVLTKHGYVVDAAGDATTAASLAQEFAYDLFVFDVRLPEGDTAGFDLVRALRFDGTQTPVLFLTARATSLDRVTGLDAGGDDYLVKPFDLEELLARLRALARRVRARVESVFEQGALSIDWHRRLVTRQGASVHLTVKEFGLLELLVSHPGRLFSHAEILERVWGGDSVAEANVLGVNVSTLRRKLGDGVVETVRGVGYRFPSETATSEMG
jgi:DNA-binding response OmpR family regulator